jgi:hypothetical protein
MSNQSFRLLALAVLAAIATAALGDTYTAIDFPGAVTTDLSGINSSGLMVGSYTDIPTNQFRAIEP